MTSTQNLAFAALLALPLTVSGCASDRDAASTRMTPEYDKSGRLRLLKYDAKDSGKVDTWSYMDGARVVRIEMDTDGDGRIDRWEYYGPEQKLERVGLSRRNDDKIDRVEYYERGVMVRAEEDTDADGKLDKWETYDGPQVTSVAFDTSQNGLPDRRLTYGPGGAATLEIDLEHTGATRGANSR